MTYFEKHFEEEGYEVLNWGYPSLDRTIEAHAQHLVTELQKIAQLNPGKPIHFLTHSLGSLVLCAALNQLECPQEAKTGKAVLLAPPSQGSCFARYLEQFAVVKKVLKNQAGKEVLRGHSFDYLGHFPPSMQVLVIAGNWGLNPVIPEENDGTLAVSETYLDTPHQHTTIHAGHKTILLSSRAFELAKKFLR